MITRNQILAVAAGLLLATTGGIAQQTTTAPGTGQTKAATKAKAPAAKMATMTGTIKSADVNKLVISHVDTKTKKATDETFVLSGSTTKTGDLTAGAKATVNYKSENGQNMASSVKVAPAKPAAAKSSAATKSKAAPAPAAK
jgi:hypothetical protein